MLANKVNLLLSRNSNFKFVEVRFEGSNKKYTYKTMFDVKVGDKAIVDSPINGLVTVDVVGVKTAADFTANYRYKWLVSLISMSHYEELNEMEDKVVAHIERAAQLKAAAQFTEEFGEYLDENTLNTLIEQKA